MKFTITEIFCEILSGLAALGVAIGGLDWRGVVTLEQVRYNVAVGVNADSLLLIIGLAYIAGILIDAIGLVFDKYFIDYIAKGPSREAIAKFYVSISSHMLAYRDNVWAYYFCYRNLLWLLVPGTAFWGLSLNKRYGADALVIVLLSGLAIGAILFIAVRELLKLYYEITGSPSEVR